MAGVGAAAVDARARTVGADWGGSTYPVFSESKNPAQAAEFSEWLTANEQSWAIVKTPPSSLFPTYLPTLKSVDVQGADLSDLRKLAAQPGVLRGRAGIPNTPWPPFMTQVLTQGTSTFGPVMTGKITLAQAFATFQKQEVAYATVPGIQGNHVTGAVLPLSRVGGRPTRGGAAGPG